ncbi:hypothetical protein [Pedobacter insulae]|uniref:Uncharacterized protein n=1 Tax=Pedobacter insulae TaxID=414048 RepID=A0A1I2WPL4_9SPHI|nr:hypothetical protein [Pedobacter insulae]SFH03244.1 hypothetical protein SAMN04489864_104204 [Pedobacter insulae]
MEKEQRFVSFNCKLVLVFILVFAFKNGNAQSDYTLNGGLKVTADFTTKDSILTLTYKNVANTSLLIWVGDFGTSFILNHNDISGKYLASPIVNEIYLIHKDIKTFKNYESYFLRNDSNELNLYNYRNLDNDQFIQVKLSLNNDSLINYLKSGKLLIKGVVTFLNQPKVDMDGDFKDSYLIQDLSSLKKWLTMVGNYTPLLREHSAYLDPIILKGISFKFNRPNNDQVLNGRSWNPHYADLSKAGLVKPTNSVEGIANFASFEKLYRFANKHYFTTRIRIK